MKYRTELIKSLPFAFLVLIIKFFILPHLSFGSVKLNALIESSDISIIFTGAFFVLAMMLAGTMSDFKEGEKIPGEIACNLEAIQDWIFLGLKAPRSSNTEMSKEPFDQQMLTGTLVQVTASIIGWIKVLKKIPRSFSLS